MLYFKLSSCCRVAVDVLCIFLMVPWVGLHFVIVTFPGHTHLHYERVVGLVHQLFIKTVLSGGFCKNFIKYE